MREVGTGRGGPNVSRNQNEVIWGGFISIQKNKPNRKRKGLFLLYHQMDYCNNLLTICGVWLA